MSFSHEELGWADLVRIVDRFDSSNAPDIEGKLLELLASGSNAVLIEISAVTLLASAGLRTILVAAKEAAKRGKKSILVGPNDSARRVLEISRLDAVLSIVDTVEDARALAEEG